MKSRLREWLICREFIKIVDAALENNRTIHTLFTLTYDTDPLIRWRALDAIGRCAGRLCVIRPEALKNLLRRLFWMMSDESGSVAQHAPEAIGEIIRADPTAFVDFIPMTVALLGLEPEDRPPFLPGILYALGRIGEAAPDSVKEGLPDISRVLTDVDLQSRAMAVWCLGRLGAREALSMRPELEHDPGEAIIYREAQLKTVTVGALWTQAMMESRQQ